MDGIDPCIFMHDAWSASPVLGRFLPEKIFVVGSGLWFPIDPILLRAPPPWAPLKMNGFFKHCARFLAARETISQQIYSQSIDHRFCWNRSVGLSGILVCRTMAARILANLLVVGSGILARSLVQAYRQALINASKSGVTQETVQNTIRRANKVMQEQEARQILGVSRGSSWDEIVKKYEVLFEKNAASGSFYLQSKVHRAKECLDAIHEQKSQSVG